MSSCSPSSTSLEDDGNYWKEIDRISNKYREAAQQEDRYICENSINVKNSVYKILTGFSGARGYVPAVRILLNQVFIKSDNISFIREDWDDFITHLQRFITNYFNAEGEEEEEEEEDIQFSEYSILKSSLIGRKMLKVTNGFSTFHFSEDTIRNIIDVNRLISSHMDLLYSVNFNHFYNNFLYVTNNILGESNYELPPHTVMLNLCDLYPHNINSHCMRECLYYNRDNVFNDLDKRMFLPE